MAVEPKQARGWSAQSSLDELALLADTASASAPVTVRLSLGSHEQLKPGGRMSLAVDPARVHLFDPRTGVAL